LISAIFITGGCLSSRDENVFVSLPKGRVRPEQALSASAMAMKTTTSRALIECDLRSECTN